LVVKRPNKTKKSFGIKNVQHRSHLQKVQFKIVTIKMVRRVLPYQHR